MFSSIQTEEHTQRRTLSWLRSRSPSTKPDDLPNVLPTRPRYNRYDRTLSWLTPPETNTNLDDISRDFLTRPRFDSYDRTLPWLPPPSPESKKLLYAASNGELPTVNKLLYYDAECADPNAVDDGGNTPLHLAAERGNHSIVYRLLQSGADATRQNVKKWTPEQLATLKKYTTSGTDAEKYGKVVEVFHHPPVVVKGVRQDDKDPQEAPKESDKGRVKICEYFKGHVSQWIGGKFKDDEYSVYDILYGDALTTSAEALETCLKEIVKEKVQGETTAGKSLKNPMSREREEKAKVKAPKSDEQTDKPNRERKELDVKKNAMRWIHLPANNHLIEKLCADQITNGECKEIEDFITDSFFEHGRRNSGSGSGFRQPLLYTRRKYPQLMSLVIPFIDADSLPLDPSADSKSVKKPRTPNEIIETQKNKELHKRARLIDDLNKDKVYTGKVHAATTLREYYGYPTGSKDVVTQYYQEEVAEIQKEGGEVPEVSRLMVKQLWLWTVDRRTIITAAPVRYNKFYPFTLQEYIVKGIDQDLNYTLEAFVKHIVVGTIEFIEDPFKAGLEQQCFDIYSNTIAKVSREISDCYEKFQKTIEGNSSYRARSDQTKFREEYKLLGRIRSIINEISILQPIFDEQHSMTKRLLKWVDIKTEHGKRDLKDDSKDNSNGAHDLQGHRENVDRRVAELHDLEDFAVSDQTDIIKERVQRLDQNARRVLESIDTLLNLKQKQASIDAADSAELQGNAVLVFTMATIIFAPITFLAALFTIPSDNTLISHAGNFTGYMVAAEFATWGFLAIFFSGLIWRHAIFSTKLWRKKDPPPPAASSPAPTGSCLEKVPQPQGWEGEKDLEPQIIELGFDESIPHSRRLWPLKAARVKRSPLPALR